MAGGPPGVRVRRCARRGIGEEREAAGGAPRGAGGADHRDDNFMGPPTCTFFLFGVLCVVV